MYHHVCCHRFGEVDEVVGVVGYPFQVSKVESLAQVLLRFTSGKTASLYCHDSTAPMHPLPFFQVFGEKVLHVEGFSYCS